MRKLVTTTAVKTWAAANLAAHITPYRLQIEGAREAYNHRYFLIGDDMGLGKSLQAAMAARMAGGRILVVCPAYLRETWRMTFAKMFRHPIPATVILSKDSPGGPNDVLVCGYNHPRLEECFEWAKNGTVIADEVHYIKTFGTVEGDAKRAGKFHKALFECAPPRFIALSGTPLENNVGEWFSVLTALSYNPEKTNGADVRKPFSYKELFQEKFCFKKVKRFGYRTVVEFYGFRNKPLLDELLHLKYLRRVGGIDLPPMIFKDVYLDDMGADKGLMDEWNAKREEGSSSPAKARSALNKTPFTCAYVKELLDQGLGPIIIFTDHLESSNALYTTLPNTALITGATPIAQRDQIVKDFQEGKIQVLVATYRAGGVGFTLTRAHHAVANDLSWVPGQNDQAFKRIHRIGQDRPCVIHRIIGSLQDHSIMQKLEDKSEVLRRAM